ncbi:MAG: metal-binding protein [Evtepia sp.]|nr:metal-binding protein [Evtepia sp.]
MSEERKGSYRYYTNRECDYYPCHQLEEGEAFNCLFCYCPLYPLGEDCGGSFQVSGQGVKDCSSCLFPHRPESYDEIVGRMAEIARRFPCKQKRTGDE